MQNEFQQRFDLITNFDDYRDWGYRRLLISGHFIRNLASPPGGFNMDEFVSRLKAMLPADAKLVAIDGASFRMSPMRDEYSVVFASKSWPQCEEGAILPELQPIFLLDAPTSEDGEPAPCIQTVYPQQGVGLVVKFDKRKHYLEYQLNEETEDLAVLAVIPRPSK